MKKTIFILTILFNITLNAQCWQSVSAGSDHTIAIKNGGTLWGWGSNSNGQIGANIGFVNRTTPIQIGTETNWTYIATGNKYTLAIKTDGTLWAWGINIDRQLGDGTNYDRYSPVQIGTDANWSSVTAGVTHTLAIKTNGTLWAWGNNNSGKLGDGTVIDRYSPIQIGTDTNWASVSAGTYHTLAIKTDGSLWAWGSNSNNQLGDYTSIGKISPTRIGTLTDWSSVCAGTLHSVGIHINGKVSVWGWNSDGQLGDGTNTNVGGPKYLIASNWVSINAGFSHSIASKSTGTLWGFGNNYYGQLGDGTNISRNSPVQIGIDTNWSSFSVGDNHTVALKTDGTLWAWGNNSNGQLGDGSTTNRNSPIMIGSLVNPSTPTTSNNSPVCTGNILSLTASTVAGATYTWTGPNGFTSTQQNPIVSTNATTAMEGTYSCVAQIDGCSSQAGTTNVIINQATTSNNGPVCAGNQLTLTASIIPGATYFWSGPNGFSSSSQNPTVSVNATSAMAGVYSVYTVANGCTSPTPGTTTVVINPIPSSPSASNNGPVCMGNTLSLTASTVTGANYSWTGPNGFTSTQQNPTISTSATATMGGVYSVIATVNGCASVTGITTAEINKITATNNGPVCVANPLLLFATPVTGAVYSWTGPNGFSSSQQNPIVSNSATTVMAGVYSVTSTVNGCTSPASVTIVTINAAIATPTVNPTVTYCQNATATQLTATGSNLLWYTSAVGGIGSSIAPIPVTTVAGTTTYYVSQTTSCESPRVSITVSVNPLPANAGTISGSATVCQGQNAVTYTVPTIANATSYVWTLPIGATGTSTSNSISVNFGSSAVSGNITVKGNNSCGDGLTSTLPITVNPLPSNAGTISGSASVCKGQNAVTYTVPTIANATSYVWTLPTGVTGTSTTNSITVNYGNSAVSGTITVKGNNSCGNGTSSSLAITVNQLPANAGTISGSTTVCQGQNGVTYTVPSIANATSYVWTLPTGVTGTSTTNSITINFSTSAVSGGIEVYGQNSCGNGSSSIIAVSVNSYPVSAGTISGNTTVCQGQNTVTYTVPAIIGATSYIWTLPNGATGTSTSNSISVNYGSSAVSGSIMVKGNNSCGFGTSSTLAITVNLLPSNAGTISGTTTVCQGQTNVFYAVPSITNATSYVWTLPSGALGTSTTNTININYGNSAVSGNLIVSGNNSCGNGASFSLPITVNSTPTPTGNISQNFTQGQTLTNLQVTGTNLIWYATLSDATNHVNPIVNTTLLVNGSTYYVTQTNNGCESSPLAITVTVALGLNDFQKDKFVCYPNPVNNVVNFENNNPILKITLFNLLGQLVEEKEINALSGQLDMSKLPIGTYLLRFKTESGESIIKLFKK